MLRKGPSLSLYFLGDHVNGKPNRRTTRLLVMLGTQWEWKRNGHTWSNDQPRKKCNPSRGLWVAQ